MPLRDSDDIYHRFRSPRPSSGQRPPIVANADVKAGAVPRFPSIGMSLPSRHPSDIPARQPDPRRASMAPPAKPAADRPRQPLAARQLGLSDIPLEAHASTTQPRAKPKRRFRLPKGLVTRGRVALVLALVLVGGAGWFGYKAISNVQKVFHGSVFSILTTTKLRGEDSGRVNILLAGNSADDPLHSGAELTDSIMIASLDVKNHTALMLSIPRDLWVSIPGYGHAKINEAYVDGERGKFSNPGYFDGGMGLLQEVVEQNFGIKADYFALVDYNALRDSVNAVGGIDITIKSSDPRGLYDPSFDWNTGKALVKLQNGVQHLNGAQALGLARARGDAYGSYGFPRSDFDRTEHQREIILALKDKALAANTLGNPVKVSGLFDSIGKNVKTDFSLSEVRRMYEIGKDIKGQDIASAGLNDINGVNLLSNYTSPTGQSALIPAAGIDDYSKIQAAIARLTTTDPVVREAATLVVLNGTKTTGLAAQTEKLLTDKGLNIVAIGDAKVPAASTTIIDTTGGQKPGTLDLLKHTFTSTTVTTDNPYSGIYQADLIVIVGADWTPPQPSSSAQTR